MNLPTVKAEVIVPKTKADRLLERLQEAEIMEITLSLGNSSESDTDKTLSAERAKVVFARSFLLNYTKKEGLAKNIIYSFIPQMHAFTATEIKRIASSKEIKDIIEECARIEEKINHLKGDREKTKEKINILEKFQGISITAKNRRSLKNFSSFVGTVSSSKKEELLHDIRRESFFIEEGEDSDGFALVYPKNREEFFSGAIRKVKAKEVHVFWDNSPSFELRENKQRLFEIEKDISMEKNKAERATAFIPKLEALIDFYDWEADKTYNLKEGEKTKRYFCVKGWVGKNDFPLLCKIAEEVDQGCLVKEINPSKGEERRVILKNKGLIESFNIVSGVYGAPKANEPDPTPYLAPFFAVSFGLALSDSGYGLMLILFSLAMKKLFKGVDTFFNLFIIGGVFTFFAGLFMGTVFGTDVAASLRFFDPVSDPMGVLVLVSVVGVTQIIAGLMIGAFHNIKEGRINAALGEKGGSIVFLLFVAAFAAGGNINFVFAGLIMLVLMNIVFSEKKNPLMRISGGAGALYGIIGYFSDVLSYSRLLALGLATGIIAMVVNMVAFIAMDMVPVAGLGFVIAALVLVVGHTFNLAISVLSSFIHSARLQFVEFFSKFMEGGGVKLKPFSKRGRFVEIIN